MKCRMAIQNIYIYEGLVQLSEMETVSQLLCFVLWNGNNDLVIASNEKK